MARFAGGGWFARLCEWATAEAAPGSAALLVESDALPVLLQGLASDAGPTQQQAVRALLVLTANAPRARRGSPQSTSTQDGGGARRRTAAAGRRVSLDGRGDVPVRTGRPRR